jgi:tetratricopeptide (TPR) repeat protein
MVLSAAALSPQGCSMSQDTARAKAIEAYRANNRPQARQYFEYVVHNDATDYKSHYYLGQVGLASGEPDYARRHFEIAYTIRQARPETFIAPEPGLNDTQLPIPSRSQIVDGLAEAIYQQKNFPQLFTFLNQVCQQYGQPDDYLRQARYMKLVGDPDAARFAHVNAARATGGKQAGPYVALGDFLDDVGLRDEATKAYRQAYTIDPNHPKLADKLRAHGLVPGPTIGLPPTLD